MVEKYSGYVGCWDDVSGAPLDVKLLRAAREVEMQFFLNICVWAERPPKSVAKSRGGKIIQGRCVDTNKGEIASPDCRARFVGKEFNTGVDATLYASTPPLEALALVNSDNCTPATVPKEEVGTTEVAEPEKNWNPFTPSKSARDKDEVATVTA